MGFLVFLGIVVFVILPMCVLGRISVLKKQKRKENFAGHTLYKTQANAYQSLLASKGLVQNVKHFDGLFTQIAVSEDGYIAVYYPHEPAREQKTGVFSKVNVPEQPERLEVLHISQINDFDIEVDGEETTHVSGGAGGAIVGGLLGGALGAVIGSSLTSGAITSNTVIEEITLVINTKNFNNPCMEVVLYRKPPTKATEQTRATDWNYYSPYAVRKHYINLKDGYDKEGERLLEEVYGCKSANIVAYKPNVTQIDELESALTQMLAPYQRSETAPQMSNADELAKFKSLLDSGVITQQEFDTKKKQLLGL